jgi:steroid delta-isomerase-like uncharacterized protein
MFADHTDAGSRRPRGSAMRRQIRQKEENMIKASAAAVSGAIMVGSAIISPPAIANEATDLIQALYQAVDARDRSAYAGMIAENFVDHDRPASAPSSATDAQAIVGLFDELGTAFPDSTHKLDLVEAISADAKGNPRAVVRWTFQGTHTGIFFGAPPSGNTVSISGIDIFTAKDGKFVEQWHVEELIDLFAQIRIE